MVGGGGGGGGGWGGGWGGGRLTGDCHWIVLGRR